MKRSEAVGWLNAAADFIAAGGAVGEMRDPLMLRQIASAIDRNEWEPEEEEDAPWKPQGTVEMKVGKRMDLPPLTWED